MTLVDSETRSLSWEREKSGVKRLTLQRYSTGGRGPGNTVPEIQWARETNTVVFHTKWIYLAAPSQRNEWLGVWEREEEGFFEGWFFFLLYSVAEVVEDWGERGAVVLVGVSSANVHFA